MVSPSETLADIYLNLHKSFQPVINKLVTHIMSEFNIDNILDGTLDDLADLPEFKPFPAGTHKAIMKMEQKVVNKHPSIEVSLKALETVELPSGSDAEPVSVGQEASVLYMLDNELGQGKFKKLLQMLATTYGADKTNRQIMEESQGAEVLVVTTLRPNKDKTKMYMDIDAVQVV